VASGRRHQFRNRIMVFLQEAYAGFQSAAGLATQSRYFVSFRGLQLMALGVVGGVIGRIYAKIFKRQADVIGRQKVNFFRSPSTSRRSGGGRAGAWPRLPRERLRVTMFINDVTSCFRR